jgi:type VI secretion system protein ImpA
MDIDLEAIAQPISPEQPAGPDMRADESRNNSYYRLRDVWDVARRKEREALNSDPEQGDQKFRADAESSAAWRSVTSLAIQMLSREAKDLEAAAFLIQSSFRTAGTAGLGEAMTVARMLVENFWDVLYPAIGEEGLSLRVRPIESLSTAPSLLIEPLRRMTIVSSSNGSYTLTQYMSASTGRSTLSMADLERAAAETDASFFTGMFEELSLCQREFGELARLMDEKCGFDESGRPQGPSLNDLKQALADAAAAVQHLAKGRIATSALESAASNGEAAAGSPGAAAGAGTAVPGRLESRNDALRMLEQVAEFFERQDPHTLLGAQIRKVVRLANMKPADYYAELLDDADARKKLFKLVGIQDPNE